MTYMKMEAERELTWAIKHRRHLHQYPELSLQEKETAKYCKDVMRSLGYRIKDGYGEGFVADIDVEGRERIAWRTDMDALPIEERNSHDFVSKIKGISHMCGHDAHMAIALLTAKILSKNRRMLKNGIRFIFQPSEEVPPGGARGMIEMGALDGVAEIYALHCNVDTDVGNIRVKEGVVTSFTTMFDIKIIGKGAHAAKPHLGLDPLFAASRLICGWKSIIPRKINPANVAVLTVTKMTAGYAKNVISDEAIIAGTIRAFEMSDIDIIEEEMKKDAKMLEERGYKVYFNSGRENIYDMIVNHGDSVRRVIDVSKLIIGEGNIITDFKSSPAGEDFCYYLKKRKGAFFFLGIRNEEKNILENLHSPNFDIDEDSIAVGAAIAAELMLGKR